MLNRIYDKYVPTHKYSLERIKAYKNFLKSYIVAKQIKDKL